jgi:hypothetical protein
MRSKRRRRAEADGVFSARFWQPHLAGLFRHSSNGETGQTDFL